MNTFFLALLTKLKRMLHRASNASLTSLSDEQKKKLFPALSNDGVTISKTSAPFFELFQSKTRVIPGMLSDEECALLFYLSTTQSVKGDIIEIGSWLGKSTVYLAEGCKVSGNGIVHAIDTFKGNVGKESLYTAPLKREETILSRFKKNIKNAGLRSYVSVHPGTSLAVSALFKTKTRLIFIDANHEYESVKLDVKLWKKTLQKGGLLIFDDYEPTFPGVIKTVQEDVVNSTQFKVLFVYKALCVCQRM